MNKKLKLRQVSSKLMACLQWKGNFPSPAQLRHKIEKLQKYLSQSPYESVGEFTLFQYDSPYSPGWMRKNELLFEVKRRTLLEVQ